MTPKPLETPLLEASMRQLMHELQVHQVELELQNEELRRVQLDLAAARDRFVDLYDFAPVGYFTLDRAGRVIEANLTGASMVGHDRQDLLERPFSRLLSVEDADRWRLFLEHAFTQGSAQRIEFSFCRATGDTLDAQLDCMRVIGRDAAPTLRVALTDISERKLADLNRRVAAKEMSANEAERRRVSREMHEELAQWLVALQFELAALDQETLDAHDRTLRMDRMRVQLSRSIATVRRISTDLRPVMIDDLGLNAAIEFMAKDMALRQGVVIDLALQDLPTDLDEGVTIAVYRMVQDALRRLSLPGQARRIGVSVRCQDSELVVTWTVGDGWTPLVAAWPEDDPVLRSLQDRAHLLHGQMHTGVNARGGRWMSVSVPFGEAARLPRPQAQTGFFKERA